MAKFIVEYSFGIWSKKNNIAVETVIGKRRIIVDAPNAAIARLMADSCPSKHKINKTHKLLWGSSKKQIRVTVREIESRWNNMA